jgi:hypothetical protein
MKSPPTARRNARNRRLWHQVPAVAEGAVTTKEKPLPLLGAAILSGAVSWQILIVFTRSSALGLKILSFGTVAL